LENPLPTLNVAIKPGLMFDYYGFRNIPIG